MKLSIIIPAYNEEKRIGPTLDSYCRFFDEKKELDYQILTVINATTDNTEQVVREYQKKYKKINYLNFEQGGKGFAVIQGIKESIKRNFDLIGFVDVDMATPPNAFYDLVENIGNYDGIIASRWKRGAIVKNRTFLRAGMSWGFNFVVRALFLLPYKDTQCGAKLFKKRGLEKIIDNLGSTQWMFDVDLLYQCKKKHLKIKEFPTIWEDKEGSKINVFKSPIQMFSGVVRLRLMYSVFEPVLRPVKLILHAGNKLLKK